LAEKPTEKPVKGKSQKDTRDKSYRDRILECQGFGHIRVDCGNLKNARANPMNASMSDESESSDFDVQKERKRPAWHSLPPFKSQVILVLQD
jgi:hypothetical protein